MYRYLAGRLRTAFNQYNAYPSEPQRYTFPAAAPPEQGEMFYQKDLASHPLHNRRHRGPPMQARAARPHSRLHGTTSTPGELGSRIVAFNREMGGLLTEEDLARLQRTGRLHP